MKRKILACMLVLTLAVGLVGCGSLGASNEQLTNLEHFTATSVDGRTLTEKDLAAKDLTLINFWTTQCGPCLEEMPDLAAFEKKLPDNVQLMTVCLLASNDAKNVQRILDEAGFTGTTLIDGDGDYATLTQRVQATPTTVLLDSQGRLVGPTIVGSQDDLEKTFLKAINKALEDTGKAAIQLEE